MTTDKYILDDSGNPVAVDDVLTWGRWFEQRDKRRVALDEIGDVRVSTVFLGLDHNWGDGPPVLWETMIFGGGPDFEDYRERYTSRADALEGHARAVALVREKHGHS